MDNTNLQEAHFIFATLADDCWTRECQPCNDPDRCAEERNASVIVCDPGAMVKTAKGGYAASLVAGTIIPGAANRNAIVHSTDPVIGTQLERPNKRALSIVAKDVAEEAPRSDSAFTTALVEEI